MNFQTAQELNDLAAGITDFGYDEYSKDPTKITPESTAPTNQEFLNSKLFDGQTEAGIDLAVEIVDEKPLTAQLALPQPNAEIPELKISVKSTSNDFLPVDTEPRGQCDIDREEVSSISSPNDILIGTFQQGAAALQTIPQAGNTKIYTQIASFLNLSEAEFTSQNYKKGLQLTREFSITSSVVAGSAIALATFHRICEGEILNKLKEMYKKIIGVGWDEDAAGISPYPKATRCSYMKIAKIHGVKPYAFLGVEKLREVERAIKTLAITGEDQIQSLFQRFGLECNLYLSHSEFKEGLDSILKKVLPNNAENIGTDFVEKPQESQDETPVIENPKDTSIESDEQKSPELDHGQSEDLSVEVTQNSSEGLGDHQPPFVKLVTEKEDTESPSDSPKGSVVTFEEGDKKSDDIKKDFLNQESLNKQLHKIDKSVDEVRTALQVYQVQSGKFDLYIISEVKRKLNELEIFLTSTSC